MKYYKAYGIVRNSNSLDKSLVAQASGNEEMLEEVYSAVKVMMDEKTKQAKIKRHDEYKPFSHLSG